MITFQNLENLSIDIILNTFNTAFSTYIIPMHLTKEIFEWKIKSENFNPKYSVGAFDGDQLIGLILHCADQDNAPHQIYNGGTGVIEGYRGQSITLRMYQYIIPFLKEEGIDMVTLEVLDNNLAAYQSYKKIGFQENRKLLSFKGIAHLKNSNSDIIIKETKEFDSIKFKDFGNTKPSWQCADHSINRVIDSLKVYTAHRGNETVGYLVYNPTLNRIYQIAVQPTYRKTGIATTLIHHLTTNYQAEISIINIDEKDDETISYFTKIGLQNHINQFALRLPL